ncbi:MAG: hypothetical protein WC650_04225 [Candidatus Doudnabacteria bacterium]
MKKKGNKGNTIKKRITQEKANFLDAYKKQWTISGAAKAIRRSRKQCHHWLRKDKKFREQFKEIKLEHIDYTVTKLVELISYGNLGAIIYFLKCQSKKWRPWEKREISGTLKPEVEQKISTDPILKKAVRFYEEELKNEIIKKTKKIKEFENTKSYLLKRA